MRRRQVLAAGSALALTSVSGCLGSESNGRQTGGNDDEPFDVEPGELLLPKAQVKERLEGGWIEEAGDDHMFLEPDVARQHVPYDQEKGEFHMDSGIVTSGVWLHEDVEAARTAFSDHPYREGWGLEEREIAVESIGGANGQHDDVRVVFRDANAIGGLRYENGHVEEGERETIGLDLAALMHESWRSG